MTKTLRLLCTALAIAAAAAGLVVAAAWQDIPQWQADGTAPVAAASLTRGREQLSCPPPGSRIAIHGDSHVAGTGGGAPVKPFGRVLGTMLAPGVIVRLRGQGGDTALMGERRWPVEHGSADLVLLAYGTNDAAPRGWLRAKRPVPVPAFAASLQRQIDQWQAAGAKVALLAPPPPGSTAMLRRIAPYRTAAAMLGERNGIAVLDPAEAFAACASAPALLRRDALHMTSAGHRCLGRWLAETLCPAQP